MKLCPNCRLSAPLNATKCAQCGHVYRTQFQPSQTQLVPPVTPPAPQAPTPPKWWQHFIPGVSQAYQADLMRHQAELGVYMQQNGLITPEMKRRATFFATLVGIVLVVFLAWTVYDSIQFNRKMDAEIERSMRESAKAEADFNRAVSDYGFSQ